MVVIDITILGQFCKQMPEIEVWPEIIELCCLGNAVDGGACLGTFDGLVEQPVLLPI